MVVMVEAMGDITINITINITGNITVDISAADAPGLMLDQGAAMLVPPKR
jgi:hypothetical protein